MPRREEWYTVLVRKTVYGYFNVKATSADDAEARYNEGDWEHCKEVDEPYTVHKGKDQQK